LQKVAKSQFFGYKLSKFFKRSGAMEFNSGFKIYSIFTRKFIVFQTVRRSDIKDFRKKPIGFYGIPAKKVFSIIAPISDFHIEKAA
jgi:hypothetical protein